jgi:energy-coupling factor transporter ATP-binding protein EcfA2
MDKNKDHGFPRTLLNQPDSARKGYFQSYTVAHPKLREANDALNDAIQEAIPGSLILVCGPAGAGKTTLRLRTEQRIATEMSKELEADPGRFAVVGIDAIPPDSGNFNWKEFYKSVLKKFDEPCINYKIKPSARKGTDRTYRRLVTNPLTAGTELREAAEEAIKHRRPAALLVDEAQHLAKMSSGRKLQDQLDSIKSLASSTEIPIVLIGTYELLALRNLSAQLSRRSVDVHFRRYRAEHSDELKAFKNVLWSFQNHLPLHEQPDLIGEWDYFYERSIGCIGVLKVWLTRALAKALKDGGKVLSRKHLVRSALSVSQCEKMLEEAIEGEALLDDSREDRARLRSSMGLEAQFTKSNGNGHVQSGENEQKLIGPRKRRRPGERNPKRDPIGNGQ